MNNLKLPDNFKLPDNLNVTNIANNVNTLKQKIINFAPTIAMSILIFLLFSTLASYVKELIIGKNKFNVKSTTVSEVKYEIYNYGSYDLINRELANLVYYFILIMGIIFSIINLGIASATIITIIASVGLAIGLALQGVLTNMVSGIYIASNELFKIGDTITINGFSGIVQKFGLFITILQSTTNNSEIIIPNNIIQNNIMNNYTSFDY